MTLVLRASRSLSASTSAPFEKDKSSSSSVQENQMPHEDSSTPTEKQPPCQQQKISDSEKNSSNTIPN